MKAVMNIVIIWITGALTMTVMKKAEPAGALKRRSFVTLRTSLDCYKSTAYWNPPGLRKIPPTKSQKNLR
jgi:hypothetical protein